MESSIDENTLKLVGYSLIRGDHPGNKKRGGVCQPNLVVNSGFHPSLHKICHHQITFCKLNLKIEYPPHPMSVWCGTIKKLTQIPLGKPLNKLIWNSYLKRKMFRNQLLP